MIDLLWLLLFITVAATVGYTFAGVVGMVGTLGYCCGWIHRSLTAR